MHAFKYRSNIDVRQDIYSLLNNEIYAPNLDQLNDPFEDTIIQYLLQLARDNSTLKKEIENTRERVGIYSLSKKGATRFPDSELMWAHYANSHKGFCIEYDVDILKTNYLFPNVTSEVEIAYKQTDYLNLWESKSNTIAERCLSFKSPVWEYENEVRLIFNDIYGVKKYPKDALKAIYFGLRMGARDREAIMKGLEGIKVDFYEMKKNDLGFTLDSILIKSNELYIKDRLPSNIYKIVFREVLPTVQNFTVLYEENDVSENFIRYFVNKFREEYAYKPSNINIINDSRVHSLLSSQRQLNDEERKLLAEHWIAFSSFDTEDYVWMYPEKGAR